MTKDWLSIVCPAYQEEDVLPLFHEELCRVVAALERDYHVEILYVDDGSRDGTLAYLQRLAARNDNVRYLSFTRNFGKEAALLAGLEHCRGDYVVTMDTDLQHPPALIPLLLDRAREGCHVVMAVREEYRPPSLVKRLLTRVFYRCMKTVSETRIDADGSDFLLLDRTALTSVLKVRERHRFLKGLVYWLGYPLGQVRFRPDDRRAGVTKFTFARLSSLGTDCLFSFSKKPLKAATWLGAATLLAALVLAVFFAVQFCAARESFSLGWSYLLVSSHFLAGSILCGLGLLGEYIGRIFEQVKQRPLYVVQEDSQEQRRASRREPDVDSANTSGSRLDARQVR